MDAQILLLGAMGASLGQLQRGRMVSVIPLGADEQAPARLHAVLRAQPPVTVLLDVVDEEFRPDRLPPLAYRDRRAMRTRRLAAQFRDASRRLLVVGPTRYDVLYAGLGQPARLLPWLEVLVQRGAPLRAIHSLPLVSAGVLRLLGLHRGAWLLLARTRTGGLRQSYFRDGYLRLSRLVPLADDFATAERTMVDELGQMRRYLARQDLVGVDAALPLALLADRELVPMGEILARDPRLTPLRLFNTVALAPALRVPAALAAEGFDALAMGLAVRRPPGAQYATAGELAPHARNRQRAWALRVSAGGLAAAAVAGAVMTGQGFALAQSAAVLAGAAASERASLAVLARALPPALLDPAQMAPVLAQAERLAADAATPEASLRAIAPHLAAAEGLRWTALEWQARAEPGTADGPAHARAVWHGEVSAFNGDYRTALAKVGQLAAILREMPGVAAVTVLESPLAAADGAAMVGQVTPGEAAPAPRFALQLAFTKMDAAAASGRSSDAE